MTVGVEVGVSSTAKARSGAPPNRASITPIKVQNINTFFIKYHPIRVNFLYLKIGTNPYPMIAKTPRDYMIPEGLYVKIGRQVGEMGVFLIKGR